MDYTELAADIAAEARLALALTAEIRDLEQKTAALLHQQDPAGSPLLRTRQAQRRN